MLQKQNFALPLGCGVDTKTDEKQVLPGKLLLLENGTFPEVGKTTKRFGLDPLTQSIITGSSISAGKALISLQKELLLANGQNLYAYSPSADAWVDRGALYGATVQSFGVSRDKTNKNYADSATDNGFMVVAWGIYDSGVSPTAGVYASVIDTATNQPILSNVLLSATGTIPRCSAANGKFYVHYRDGQNIYVRSVSSTTPTTFAAQLLVANDMAIATPTLEVCPSGTDIVLAYSVEPTGLKIGILDANGQFSGTTATHTDSPVSMGLIAYNNSDVANDGIYLVYWDTTTGPPAIRALIYNLTLSNLPAPVVIGLTGVNPVSNIGLAQTSASGIAIYATYSNAVIIYSSIVTATITRLGVATGIVNYIKNLWLYSKPIMINNIVHLVGIYPSTIQGGYFVLAGATSPRIINRVSYQNAGIAPPYPNNADYLSTLLSLGSGQYSFANTIKTTLSVESGVLFSSTGIQFSKLDFDDNKLWQAADLGRQKYIAAGMLCQYDGEVIVEAGFNVYPQDFVQGAAAAGAVITAGTRQYIVVYEWENLNGDIDRSAPSLPLTVTTGVGLASQNIDNIPYLNLTQKVNVKVCIYRTISAGTTFYKIGTQANDPTTSVFQFVDTNSDVSIVDNELLYTTGGVVDNIPPPSCASVFSNGNRLFLVGLEDPNAIWYSKEYQIGTQAAFNDSFVMRIDQGQAGITSGGILEEKNIFFKDNDMFVIAGQGPLPTGAQNDFSNPVNIATDVGCPYPKSVIRNPTGLMFKSNKGYYILDQALNVVYKGSAVEDYNSLSVTSAVLLDQVNQIRWTNSDGSAVVYDYYSDQWYMFTNYLAVGACDWNGVYALLRSNGQANYENTATYLDNGVAVQMRLKTPWLQLSGIQGFQRIYEAIFLGTKSSNHVFVAKVYYDFEPTLAETFTIDMATIVDPIEQLKLKPARQKCQAIQFEIYDTNATNIDGAGVSFSALTLSLGIKGGTNRVPAAQVVNGS